MAEEEILNDWNNLSYHAGCVFLLTCPECKHQAQIDTTRLMIYAGAAAKLKDV